MLSVESCRKILNRGNQKFNEKDTDKLRHLLYQMAEIQFKIFKTIGNDQERNSLHQSLN